MQFVKNRSIIANNYIVIICIIATTGCIMRIIGSFHGFPFQLHPDEHVIVNNSIDMIKRHSWEAYFYERPDQFEIKCNAILFTLASWAIYHIPANEAFNEHKHFFYLIARLYTIIFGILLIPLSIFFIKRVFKNIKINNQYTYISLATILSFSCIFIEESHFATPDIPLTFFILLFTYYFVSYLETNRLIFIVICSTITGIGISIKYPMAIMCIPIAFMIIYMQIKNNKMTIYSISNIVKNGIYSILIILFTLFIICPNLFTDIDTVYKQFIYMATPTHLGHDGLGFMGNLFFYISTAIHDLGYISIIPFFVGLFFIVKNKNYLMLSFFNAIIFLICISIVPRHFVRYGDPIYLFYDIIVSIGIGYSITLMKNLTRNHYGSVKSLFICYIYLSSIIVLINIILSGISVTKQNLLRDTRIYSMEFCKEYNFTKNNTLYEGYTPLAPSSAGANVSGFNPGKKFSVKGNNILVNADNNKKYFIKSDSYSGRFKRESHRYAKQVELYDTIDKNCRLIYRINPDGNYHSAYDTYACDVFYEKPYAILNIFYSIKYLLQSVKLTGPTISIYDLSMRPQDTEK